ncbi:hypothetical protein LUZ61_013878 [Rhynchospora tenuis]|uniref:Uncharacterized protein n=1 Tax=Rhynchospora tenuis TaxID=198213 RepID=A0AAD5Z2Y9_9POAL|nr:hypothetical protein LUZ61_013878 [Rhynchospora tenuis]
MSNQTFLIINQNNGDYGLAIRGGKVVLTVSNPQDPYQRWFKRDNGTKDEEDQPSFAIVNEATNEAIKHEGTSGPMSLVRHDLVDSSKDNTVLWTESKIEDQGYRYIRRASSIRYHITPSSLKISDGRIVDLWDGDHISERWKFVPNSVEYQPKITISCQRKEGYNLTIRDGTVMLAPADPKDKNQIWIKDISYAKQVKDQDGKRAFALVNKATGKAIKHGFGPGNPVQLVTFDQNYLDSSILWTDSDDKELGFREIRMASNTNAVFQVDKPDSDKPLLALQSRNGSNDQRWKFQQIIKA